MITNDMKATIKFDESVTGPYYKLSKETLVNPHNKGQIKRLTSLDTFQF